MGWHREAELLPQVGGGAIAGHPLTGGLHQRWATQPHHSTVSPSPHNDTPLLAAQRLFLVFPNPEERPTSEAKIWLIHDHLTQRACACPQASFSVAAKRQCRDWQWEGGRREVLHPLSFWPPWGGAALQVHCSVSLHLHRFLVHTRGSHQASRNYPQETWTAHTTGPFVVCSHTAPAGDWKLGSVLKGQTF